MYSKSISAEDLDTAIRTVWGEARGESRAGKRAVAWVIRNRSELDLWADGKADWWGETLAEVCKKKFQFSCWNARDPNHLKLLQLTRSDPDYLEIAGVVTQVLVSAVTSDPTKGATHYHAKGYDPAWAKSGRWVGSIGNHVFYSEVK